MIVCSNTKHNCKYRFERLPNNSILKLLVTLDFFKNNFLRLSHNEKHNMQ